MGGGSFTEAGKPVAPCPANDIRNPADMDKLRVTGGVIPPIRPPTLRQVCVPTTLSAGDFSTLSGVTGLVVAHRASTVLLADRVAMLVEGRIAHVGTHQELLATVPEYRELLSADYSIEPDLAEEALR